MKIINRALLAVLVATLALSVAPLGASAAPAKGAPAPTDIWESARVSLVNFGSTQEPTLIIQLLVDPSVKLPAEGAVYIPKGSGARWVGEVFADPSKDTSITAKASVKPAGTLVTFTVSKSRAVSLELRPPKGTFTATPEQNQGVHVSWPSAGPLDEARLEIVAPKGLEASPKPKGVRESTLASAETSYYKKFENVKADQKLKFDLVLALAKPDTTVDATSDSAPKGLFADTRWLLPTILALLAVAVIALVVVIVRQRNASE